MDTISGNVTKTFIEILVKAAANLVSEKLIEEFSKAKLKKRIGQLYTKTEQVGLVKTLLVVNDPVDLHEFYCDSYVWIDGQRKKISEVKSLGTIDNILIEGIAGQGKSIFMRYLCVTELPKGGYLPIFIELRRIQVGETLIDHIQRNLATLGLEITGIAFDKFIKYTNLLLLLDGFDEVCEKEKSRIINEIELLIAKNEVLRVIISSRPHSGMEVSTHFKVIKMANLDGKEYQKLVRKLIKDTSRADALIEFIEEHWDQWENLLTTPLTVTILVLSYLTKMTLPPILPEFYDQLFYVLLVWHDLNKSPRFRRERECVLSDDMYRQVFEAICFLAKSQNYLSLDHDRLCELTSEALELYEQDIDASKFIKDIVNITSLILREGTYYHIIHKSVQEYFTASFIKRKPDSPRAIQFYRHKIHKTSARWSGELLFLSHIDKYQYNKHFYLPGICKWLGITKNALQGPRPKATIDSIKAKIGSAYVFAFDLKQNQCDGLFLTGISDYHWLFDHKMGEALVTLKYEPVLRAIETGALTQFIDNRTQFVNPPKRDLFLVSGDEIIDKGLMQKDFLMKLDFIFADLFSEARKILSFLHAEEEDSIIYSVI